MCRKQSNRIRIAVVSVVFVLCSIMNAYAQSDASIDGNVLTYQFSTASDSQALRFRLYILANGAQIRTYGSEMINAVPQTDHTGVLGCYDISDPTTGNTSNLKYTDESGNRIKVGSKVEYKGSIKNGVFTATVKIYDPSPDITGLAFVGTTYEGGGTYYADIGGTHDISGYVRKIYYPDEPEEPDEQESASQERESRAGDIKDKISDVNKGGSGSDRSPCILKRLLGRFSS